MIKIICFVMVLIFCNVSNSYAMVERWPSDNNYITNNWYYTYTTDDFNDDTNNSIMVSMANGTFSNTVETNANCSYVLGYVKYLNNAPNMFIISIMEYGFLPFEDYTGMFQASVKYNGEVYNHPYVLNVYNFKNHNYITITESSNSELYHILLYLLSSQTSFKLRLEKYSSSGINYNNSYICEVPATNFLEVYNVVYPSVVG